MRRWVLSIVFAALTLSIGLLVGYWRGDNQPKSDRSGLDANVAPSVEQKRSYERGPAGEGAQGGRGASFMTLNSSDGMRFTKWTTDYDTAARATTEFQTRLKEAIEIISRESFYDEYGRNIGEKAVAKFEASNHYIGPASLLWTDREIFCHVDSSSVQNILEYRRDFGR